jgi:hypothetical protein
MLLAIPLTAAICGKLYAADSDPNPEDFDDYFKPSARRERIRGSRR